MKSAHTQTKDDPSPSSNIQILDIGGSQQPQRIKATLQKKLFQPDEYGRYFLPDILFSNDRGLQLWREINSQPDYYQTDDEIELLRTHAEGIVEHIPAGSVVIDLGCGDVRKVIPLLNALELQQKPITYYGLDLSSQSLSHSLSHLHSKNYTQIQSFGLWGTFEDCLQWLSFLSSSSSPSSSTTPNITIPSDSRPRIFLSLGSIFGNDRFDRAVRYLKPWAAALRNRNRNPSRRHDNQNDNVEEEEEEEEEDEEEREEGGDKFLLGIDGCQTPTTVWNSYHDEPGLFEKFVRNAFEASNEVLGWEWYRHEDWDVRGVLLQGGGGQQQQQHDSLVHRFVLTARREVECTDGNGGSEMRFPQGTEIECYEGFKYGGDVMGEIFERTGLRVIRSWRSASGRIGEFLVTCEKGDGLSNGVDVDG